MSVLHLLQVPVRTQLRAGQMDTLDAALNTAVKVYNEQWTVNSAEYNPLTGQLETLDASHYKFHNSTTRRTDTESRQKLNEYCDSKHDAHARWEDALNKP